MKEAHADSQTAAFSSSCGWSDRPFPQSRMQYQIESFGESAPHSMSTAAERGDAWHASARVGARTIRDNGAETRERAPSKPCRQRSILRDQIARASR